MDFPNLVVVEGEPVLEPEMLFVRILVGPDRVLKFPAAGIQAEVVRSPFERALRGSVRSSFRRDQGGQLPFVRGAVVAQNEAAPIVHPHLEIAVPRIEPAVEDLDDREAPLAQREGARLLLAPIAGIAFNANFQCIKIDRHAGE